MNMSLSEEDLLKMPLQKLAPYLIPILEEDRSAAFFLLKKFSDEFFPETVRELGTQQRIWELTGLHFFNLKRFHEALVIFNGLYKQMLRAQNGSSRVHKGMPLVWISECFKHLGFSVHSKRYLMLTLCEDALRENGKVSPNHSGVYFRLVWGVGFSDRELQHYAREFYELAQRMPDEAKYPEALLQQVDDSWLTELPSPVEASSYSVNTLYIRHLLDKLGDRTGEALELLAEYLMSCMPGCRTRRRVRSGSTEYDIVCAMEGFEVDFRSELGRYFVCECKDWNSPVDFTHMAKFCRVLDSIKSRFGLIFSNEGISGEGRTDYSEREQLKVFQDRGIVIVVINNQDLQKIESGENLVQLLRRKYETVRLDLR